MKPVEIILRRGKGETGRMIVGINLIKIYCKHKCKYTKYPLYNYYMLIKLFLKKKEKHF
jgi:hypothetical protein